MAVNTAVPLELKKRREDSLEKGISSQNGVDAFSRILGNTLSQVIVSPQDLQTTIEQAFTASSAIQELEQSFLLEPAHSRPELKNAYVAPRNDIEQTIAEVWQELLGIGQVGTHDNFFELGGDSLLAVRLFAQIKKIFDKNLPLATLLQAPTVEQQASILDKGEWSALWSSLIAIQTGSEKLPLFCLHGADGNILMYQKLARYLNPDQPVYGLQAKGLDGKEAPHNRFEDMAADYIRQIRTIQPEGPYLLAGFSAAGVLALEVAQQFHAQGQKVALLAFLDTYCPVYIKPKSFHTWVSSHLGNLLRLEPKEKLTYFLEGTKQMLNKIPSKLYQSIGRSFPQAYRKLSSTSISIANNQATTDAEVGTAYIQALRDYVPQAYQGRVILFRSSDSPWWIANDLELGWGGLAAEGLEIHKVSGSHTSIIGANIRDLAEKLQPYLDRAQGNDENHLQNDCNLNQLMSSWN